MKKLLFVMAIALVLGACNNAADEKAGGDTTSAPVSVDTMTPPASMDTSSMGMDSSKMKADSAIKK